MSQSYGNQSTSFSFKTLDIGIHIVIIPKRKLKSQNAFPNIQKLAGIENRFSSNKSMKIIKKKHAPGAVSKESS